MLLVLVAALQTVSLTTSLPTLSSDLAGSTLVTHPRIRSNCQINFQGDEGRLVEGFQLNQVFLVVTPGLQTPTQPHKFSVSPWKDGGGYHCSLQGLPDSDHLTEYFESLKLKEKVRGRDVSSAFKIFRADAWAQQCENHNLSLLGLSQLIHLGHYLFNRYGHTLSIFKNVFLPTGFANTLGDQTLFHSLSALLYGFLTEKQFVYSQIKKLPHDFFESVDPKKNMYNNIHYYVQKSFSEETYVLKDSKVSKMRSWFEFGLTAKDIISHLSHQLCSQHSSQSPSRVSLSDSDQIISDIRQVSDQNISDIFQASDTFNNYLFSNQLFRSYSMIRTSSIRRLLKSFLDQSNLDNERRKIPNDEDVKLVLVGELFMLSLLAAWNVSLAEHLTPASRLVVETLIPVHGAPVNATPLAVNASSADPASAAYHPMKASVKANLATERRQEQPEGSSTKLSAGGPMLTTAVLSKQVHGLAAQQQVNKNVSQVGGRFVRVLYNGQVVTSVLPGCQAGEYSDQGLCSFDSFAAGLNMAAQPFTLNKEEL